MNGYDQNNAIGRRFQRLAAAVASPRRRPSTATFPSVPAAMAADGKRGPASPPEAPSAKKGVFMRRIFPFLLVANIFIGVYVFAKTYKRDQEKKNAQTAAAAAAVAALSSPAAESADPTPTPPPKRVLPPIPEDEQRQVYKWMLEEKRKIRPRNAAEKNEIDEGKALLKEFIRAESLPRL